MKTKQQIIEELQKLELEAGELRRSDPKGYHIFPKLLKLMRQMQRLRDKL